MKVKISYFLISLNACILVVFLIGCTTNNQKNNFASQTELPGITSTSTPSATFTNENIIQAPTLYSQTKPEIFTLAQDAIPWETTYIDSEGNQTILNVDLYKISDKTFHYLSKFTESDGGRFLDFGYSPQLNSIIVYTQTMMYEFDRDIFDFFASWDIDTDKTNVLAVSPDGTQFAYTVDDEIYVKKTHSIGLDDQPFLSINPGFIPTHIAFSPDGEKLITTSTSGEYDDSQIINYTIYDLNGNVIFTTSYLENSKYSFYYVTEENKAIFVIKYMDIYNITEYPYDVYVIDLESGILTASYTNKQNKYSDTTEKILIGDQSQIPTEEQITAWNDEILSNSIEKYNMHNGHCYPGIPENNIFYDRDYFREITYDDKTAVFMQYHLDEAIGMQLVDLTTCDVIAEESFFPLYGVLFSPNDRYIALTDGFNTYLWENTFTFRENKFIPGSLDTQPQNIYVFNADTTRIVTSMEAYYQWEEPKAYAEYTLDVWDLETMETILKIKPSNTYLRSLHATSDPKIILAFDSQGLDIWNIFTGELIKHFQTQLFDFDQETDSLWLVLTENDDTSAIVQIDYQTGETLHEIKNKDGVIQSVEILDQGKLLEIVVRSNEPGQNPDINVIFDTVTGEMINHEFVVESWNYIESSGCCDNMAEIYPGIRMNTAKYFPGEFVQETNSNIITHSGRSYFFWDKQTDQFIGQIDFDFEPKEVVISPNALFIAVLSEGGQLFTFFISLP